MRDSANALDTIVDNKDSSRDTSPAEEPTETTLFEDLLNGEHESDADRSFDPWQLATEIENMASLATSVEQSKETAESQLTQRIESASAQSVAEVVEMLARQLKRVLKRSRRLEIENERVLADREQAMAFAEAALDKQQAIISELESLDDTE